MSPDQATEIFRGHCVEHGCQSRKVDQHEAWITKHEAFAETSLKEQAQWKRGIEKRLHRMDLDRKDALHQVDRKIVDVQNSLKSWAIAILTVLTINLAVQWIKG